MRPSTLLVTAAALLFPLAPTAQQSAPALPAFVAGAGRPVVMLGGGVYGADGFAPHAELLKRDFTVIRLQTLNFHRAINATLASMFPSAERVEVKGGHTAPTSSRDDFLQKWRAFLARH